MRPFYFMLSVWGERFSDYLANLCIPSLLAPGNVPALVPGNHKFLIACPNDDWERLLTRPSIHAIARHLKLVHLEIPPPPPGVSGAVHMGIGHKLATERCFADRAYGVAMTPDMMVSDGTVTALQEAARDNTQVVLCTALRFEEETLFAGLRKHGLIDKGCPITERVAPLALSGRQMVDIGVPAFHSQTKSYYFESPAFATGTPAAIWEVPGNRGALIHSLSWAPMLLDYAALKAHDTRALEEWTMDGDYVHANFGLNGTLKVIDDSDDMMIVSWAPATDRPIDLRGRFLCRHLPPLRRLINGVALRHGYRLAHFDALKQRIFMHPVRWHVDDLNDSWRDVERQARRIIEKTPKWVDRTYPLLFRINCRLRWNWARLVILVRALRGDSWARDIIRLRLREAFGKQHTERPPDPH